jgi:dTDP-4-dehydrorhamnose reductase
VSLEALAPVVLIGANGQLGSDLGEEYCSGGRRLIALTHADLDICDHDQVTRALEALDPAIIVNTAAFHKVETCEVEVAQAFAVNCFAVRNLALVADRLNSCLVHISSDYVFDGQQDVPYSEAAAPNPINVYGVSKAAGEFFVRNLCRRHLLIRTSGLFGHAGSSGKGGNFAETMLKRGRELGAVSVVEDQVFSPTYTADLARMIWRLVDLGATGLFHITNTGSCSWAEFARSIFGLSGVAADVRSVRTATTGTPVRRPHYSVLENRRLRAEGFGQLRPWREALRSYMAARSEMVLQAGTSV